MRWAHRVWTARWLRAWTGLVRVAALLGLGLGVGLVAHAHLIEAQRGTVNVVGDGAFVVLSVHVAAFQGVDDDGDGLLSAAELSHHRSALAAQVAQRLALADRTGPRPLVGLLLSLAPGHDAAPDRAPQLVLMARFALVDPAGPMTLHTDLFGPDPAARVLRIMATRGEQAHGLMLSPAHPQGDLFPTTVAVMTRFARLGAEHIAEGWDHLVFLAVVVAGVGGMARLVGVLTAFTAGHAFTLAASAFGWIQAPSSAVEPAIAATIVAMAALEWRQAAGGTRPLPVGLWVGLVFGCAMVHGLGLAAGWAEAGLEGEARLTGLLAFNAGVEGAQLAVAVPWAWALQAAQRRLSPARRVALVRGIAGAAGLAGTAWFLQRVLAG